MSMTFYVGIEIAPRRWDFLPAVEGVNVSNSNASAIIAALHYQADEDGFGPVEIGPFIERCTAALRNGMRHPDAGIEPTEYVGERGARFIDCGRPQGYIQQRIYQLIELARAGAAAGGTHIYAA